jgi:transcriptional regulator with XRE-family HTH domain
VPRHHPEQTPREGEGSRLGQTIKEARQAKGWTQYDLQDATEAAGCLVRQHEISRLERGSTHWPNDPRKLESLARALDLPPALLVSVGKYPNLEVPIMSERLSRVVSLLRADQQDQLAVYGEFLVQQDSSASSRQPTP